jgi:hypothetical protein
MVLVQKHHQRTIEHESMGASGGTIISSNIELGKTSIALEVQ